MPGSDAASHASRRNGKSLIGALFAASLAIPAPTLAFDAPELPYLLQEQVQQAQKACSDFENGRFVVEWGAVTRVDLDGDLRSDWVLDEAAFACSSAASLYCGTGGCMSHFLLGDVLSTVLNQGWNVVDIGPLRVLLTDVHGSQCGGINPTPCVTASTWDKEAAQWRSATTEWE